MRGSIKERAQVLKRKIRKTLEDYLHVSWTDEKYRPNIKKMAKYFVTSFGSVFPLTVKYELEHGLAALACGGTVKKITWGSSEGPAYTYFHVPDKIGLFFVNIAPALEAAFVGVPILAYGLKKRSPIATAYGTLSLMSPLIGASRDYYKAASLIDAPIPVSVLSFLLLAGTYIGAYATYRGFKKVYSVLKNRKLEQIVEGSVYNGKEEKRWRHKEDM